LIKSSNVMIEKSRQSLYNNGITTRRILA